MSALQNFRNQWKESGEHDLCNLICRQCTLENYTVLHSRGGHVAIFLFIVWKILKLLEYEDLKILKWPPEFAGQILRCKIYTYTLKTLKMADTMYITLYNIDKVERTKVTFRQTFRYENIKHRDNERVYSFSPCPPILLVGKKARLSFKGAVSSNSELVKACYCQCFSTCLVCLIQNKCILYWL